MTSYNQLLKIAAYWVLLLCLFSLKALADESAAVVLFSHGVVTVTTSTGSHDLVKGAEVAAGSTIHTGDNSRVQLRFTDGGLVSLMPNSIFAVDSYQQPTANDQGSVSMNLVKGGLRTLTGTIGKQNKDSYELKTKVATLGIRGTQYVATFDNNVMHVHVGDGSVLLFNEFGELLLHAGQRGIVFLGQPPQLTTEQPAIASTSTDAASGDDSDDADAVTQEPANSISHSLPMFMINQPVDNLPVAGTLSYRFNSNYPQNASAIYSPTGMDTEFYELVHFQLDIYLNGNDAVATVDLEIDASTHYVQYSTDQPEKIHWGSGSNKGSFWLNTTANGNCPSCQLVLSGALVGQGLTNAWVDYKLTDSDLTQLTGSVILDLVPALEREVLYAVYHQDSSGAFGEASMASHGGELTNPFSDFWVSVSGSDFNDIDFVASPGVSLTKDIRKTGELVWGSLGVQSSSIGDSQHFFVFASPGPVNLDALGTGVINYKLDQATAVHTDVAGSHSLAKFDLNVYLGTGPSFDVDMALNSNGNTLQYTETGLGGTSWLAQKGAFSFTANDDPNCSNCELIVNGVIAGANQQQAGVTYHFRENNDHYFGAAALKKTP